MSTDLVPLTDALAAIRGSIGHEPVWVNEWTFPDIEQWVASFQSLDDALPIVAELVGSGRYIWWVTGDVAEALMRKFGRTEAVKRTLGSVFGCKARTVEYRARAAVMFPPEKRYPDVPIELYREALMWGDQQAIPVLEAALDEGTGWADLRMERYEADGRDCGDPIFSRARARLSWFRYGGNTEYTINILEEGGPRFAHNDFDVVVTVTPIIEKKEGAHVIQVE